MANIVVGSVFGLGSRHFEVKRGEGGCYRDQIGEAFNSCEVNSTTNQRLGQLERGRGRRERKEWTERKEKEIFREMYSYLPPLYYPTILPHPCLLEERVVVERKSRDVKEMAARLEKSDKPRLHVSTNQRFNDLHPLNPNGKDELWATRAIRRTNQKASDPTEDLGS